MELHCIYPEDIRADRLAFAQGLPPHDGEGNKGRGDAQFIVDFLDMLEDREGPTKWLQLNHEKTLSFFAFDPDELRKVNRRQDPQVVVFCHATISQVRYLLPHEQRPWEWTEASTRIGNRDNTLLEMTELLFNAFDRCESRWEYLTQSTMG